MGIVGKSVYFLRLCVHLFYRLSVFLSFVLASLMLVAKLHSLSASASYTGWSDTSHTTLLPPLSSLTITKLKY